MKKIILVLIILLEISCSSNSSDSNALNKDFTSTIVANGVFFNPNNGIYSFQTASLNSQKQIQFVISNIGSDGKSSETLIINIMFPISKTSITGVYDFGPGTSQDLLVNATFARGDKIYDVLGYSLNITDLGNSRYKFEFIDSFALDGSNNFNRVEFKGNTEGYFQLK